MDHSSAANTLARPSRKHQDWFDENAGEIGSLLERTQRLHKAHQDDTSSVSKKAVHNNICLEDGPEQTLGHARLMAEQESRGNSVFCRQKGNSLWPKEFWSHPTT